MITGKLEREQSNSAWVKAFEYAGAWLPVWPVESRACRNGCARAPRSSIEIDDDAVRFIVERTEGNLLAAQQELEKLRMSPAASASISRGPGVHRRQRALRRVPAGRSGAGGRRATRAAHPRRTAQRGVEPTLALWSLDREIHNVWGPRNPSSGSRGWQKPSAALENAKRRAARLPYARLAARVSRADRMIKGQHRGDAWDEMALIVVEFAGRKTLPLTQGSGTRAA